MIEVVGFLSVDPALSGEFQQEKDPLLDPEIESDAETITHNPPPSLVPRLHAVYIKKLEHCNPLVEGFNQGRKCKSFFNNNIKKTKKSPKFLIFSN